MDYRRKGDRRIRNVSHVVPSNIASLATVGFTGRQGNRMTVLVKNCYSNILSLFDKFLKKCRANSQIGQILQMFGQYTIRINERVYS